jgi:hypothetical protein
VGILDSIRRWIDGEGAEDPLQTVDEAAKPRRVWEEFMVKLAREVESVMEAEMFTPPDGLTYIPREYLIFLSNEDDKDWQGEKRRALEQGLFHVLSKRAKELAGKNKLATKTITLELRIDGTLNKGEFRVQPVWDAGEGGNTTVLPRELPSTSGFTGQNNPSFAPMRLAPEPVMVAADDVAAVTPAEAGDAAPEAAESDSTVVRPRAQQLQTCFVVEVWLEGIRQERYLAPKTEITIGRGSRSIAVDLALKGDPEISRIHAVLLYDQTLGQYWLTPKGRNPTLLNGYELPREEHSPVRPDDKIEICRYTLRVQPA